MEDVVLLFPGQGSQYVGMGADLAEAFPAARGVFRRADELLGYELSRVAWEGPEVELVATENAQPAILVHSLAVWSVLQDELVGHVRCAAGHSLGEFSAYAAAGSLPLEEAVRLVRRRGELMAEAGRDRPGTMAAVVGLESAVVERLCATARRGHGVVVAANHNSPNQVVISGEAEAVERAGELAREAGARMVKRLPVSGAFHSPLMAAAEAGLEAQLDRLSFGDPAFPVISNVTAEPVTEGGRAKELLVQQLTSPVRWTDTMERLAGEGLRRVLELGPGEVLAGLARRTNTALEVQPIGDAEGIRRFRGEAK